jgi:AcrR family transcriptional regulator
MQSGRRFDVSSPVAAADDTPRPLRADARRNRDALLEHASAAFAEHGVEASLEDIARRTGVGIGTLYRHFPTRDALVVAAYRHGVEQLCKAATDLAAANPPDIALEQWMLRFVGYVATKRGLAATLKTTADSHAELFAYVHGLITTSITSLLDAAAKTGKIRGDVDGLDLMRALGGICMASDQVGSQDQARRLVALLMDGMRYGAPERARP